MGGFGKLSLFFVGFIIPVFFKEHFKQCEGFVYEVVVNDFIKF